METKEKSPLISIVIPIFNEGEQIRNNINIIHKILSEEKIFHEFILIDDGSTDDTWSQIQKISTDMDGVYAIKLSRNFGKEAALCAGLDAVRGDACVILDADLQHPPSLIPEMVRLWKEEGYDVVEGVKSSRGKERFINKLGAVWFYKVLDKLSGIDLNSASDFKLVDAKVLSAWKQMGEREIFFRGMSEWVGFHRKKISFEVHERTAGTSKWSVVSLIRLAITAITSFSSLPLHIVTFMGIIFLIGSFILGIQTLYMKFRGMAIGGFTTVILLLLIIGSTLMISLGIIGTYIAKIFNEVKGRPRYIVAQILDKNKRNGID